MKFVNFYQDGFFGRSVPFESLGALPRIGERVYLNGYECTVTDVTHNIDTGDTTVYLQRKGL